ncbi:MAG TPA: hypothetical protein VKQ36_16695, partial [Ktedonobacterales bacterium]|nr:hypothetical protein [Ktedonobacterales bacterium]
MIGKRALRKWRVSVADRRCGGPVGSSDGRWLAFALALLTLALTISGCNSSVPTIKNPTATSGAIRLTTDLSSYSVSQAIGVTLMNTSTTTFYTQNDHSA